MDAMAAGCFFQASKYLRTLTCVLGLLVGWIAGDFGFAYSLDLSTVTVLSGPAGSEFGSSLSFHQHGSRSMLLVGAPRGSYSNPDWAKGSQMKQTGILYQCPLKYTDHGSHSSHGSHGNCHQLPVDTRAESMDVHNNPLEVKSRMRMGDTVLSMGPDGDVMVCASRYGKLISCKPEEKVKRVEGKCYGNPVNSTLFDPVGKCILLPGNLNLSVTPPDIELSQPISNFTPTALLFIAGMTGGNPYSVTDLGWAPQSSSFGFSMTASNQDVSRRFPLSEVTIGGPGTMRSAGQLWSFNLTTIAAGKARQQVLVDKKEDAKTSFSVAHGDFDGDNIKEIAVSQPGTALTSHRLMKSAVWIVPYSSGKTSALDIDFPVTLRDALLSITSDQFGEFFGYSLLSVDTDNNGVSELLVSAPYYMDTSRQHHSRAYNFGRVLYYSAVLRNALVARKPGSRAHIARYDFQVIGRPASMFGSSLASLGDIDQDGYRDVAIGAPGEIINGQPSGAVYIHLGSSTGLSQTSSQRIVSSQSTTRGFGYSLAYGWDIDGNGFDDLAVGAVGSAEAFVFRSRPVISVTWRLFTQRDTAIGLHSSFKVTVCGRYTGPAQPTLATLKYNLSVKGAPFYFHDNPLLTDDSGFVNLTSPYDWTCSFHAVYILGTVSLDICDVHTVSLESWTLIEQRSSTSSLAPILARDQRYSLPITRMVRIVPLCVSCTPAVTARFDVVDLRSPVQQLSPLTSLKDILYRISSLPSCHIYEGYRYQTTVATWLCKNNGHIALKCPSASGSPLQGNVLDQSTPYMAFISSKAVLKKGNHLPMRDLPNGVLALKRTAILDLVIEDDLLYEVDVQNPFSNSEPQELPVVSSQKLMIATFSLRNAGKTDATSTEVTFNYPSVGIVNSSQQHVYVMTGLEASVHGVACSFSPPYEQEGVNEDSHLATVSDTTLLQAYPLMRSLVNQPFPLDCGKTLCLTRVKCLFPPLISGQVQRLRVLWNISTSSLIKLGLAVGKNIELPVSISLGGVTAEPGYSIQASHTGDSRTTVFRLQPPVQRPEFNVTLSACVSAVCTGLLVAVFWLLFVVGFFDSKRTPEPGEAKSDIVLREILERCNEHRKKVNEKRSLPSTKRAKECVHHV